jgi:hypothetical protein
MWRGSVLRSDNWLLPVLVAEVWGIRQLRAQLLPTRKQHLAVD